MPSVTSPSATRRRKRGHSTRRRTIFSLAAGFLALSVGGCATDSTGPSTALATTHEATVAFESVDGPPPAIFQKLVQHLSHEADARQMAVVSRTGSAQYRVRSYLAAQVENGQASIAWVWDVYDADHRRSLRISGEEAAGPAGRNAWASVNDQVLGRIARTGMDRLVAFLAAPPSEPAPPPADEPRYGVATATLSPDAVGPADVPLPRRRPGITLAYAPVR